MLLFAVSFLLVFASSYFLTSILAVKKDIVGFIYILLIAFAQIVLTFEVLSLFSLINQGCVLVLNAIFFLLSAFIWNKKFRPLWSINPENFLNKVKNSFKLDKSLYFLFIGFCIFLFVSVFLCLILPITNADAQAYHVNRSLFWILQGSLNHFDCSDIRNLCLPINSEILYSWILLFVKKDVFLGFFSLTGFILALVSVFNIMSYLSFSTRRKLWVIFILSSLPSVLVQPSGTETDIIIAALVTSSIFLFWYALKNNKITPIYMSSLAYALAIGTKTPSILAIPGVAILLIYLSYRYKNYKQLAYFVGFWAINFLIFSSYNYILNYIQFKNFVGGESFIIASKNYYGIKGTIANFIKYIFMYVDFTGFKWADYVNKFVVHYRSTFLYSLGLGNVWDGMNSTKVTINKSLLEPLMGAGVLGLFVYLPCVVTSLFKPIIKPKLKRAKAIFLFSLVFVINVLVLSNQLTYMTFSVRFLMFFMVISASVLGYSYFSNKNPLKYLVILFALYYFVFVATNFWARPYTKITQLLQRGSSITNIRYRAICMDYEKKPNFTNSACALKRVLTANFTPEDRILAFMNNGDNLYILKMMEFDGYKIDYKLMEDVGSVDFRNYDGFVTTSVGQRSTLVKYFNGHSKMSVYEGNTKIASCQYKRNPNLGNLSSISKDANEPFLVQCNLNKDYIDLQHFKFIENAGVRNLNSNEFVYYKIYKKVN